MSLELTLLEIYVIQVFYWNFLVIMISYLLSNNFSHRMKLSSCIVFLNQGTLQWPRTSP